MSQPERSRAPEWVEKKLFPKFVAMYGTQKVGAMFSGADRGEVHALWGAQLGQYRAESIAIALQRLVDSGSEWPPTLPEFAKLCRESAQERATAQERLPAPRGHKPLGYSLPDLSMNREGVDHLRWLRRVGHITVARALPDIARGDARARAILEEHIRTDFAHVVDEEAAKWLRQWYELNPRWLDETGEEAA